ncbi:MAG: 2-deoxy-scyllo-inosose synthase [Actinomycetota bacterium]|nr:2-deoxy-scyllo-inosose synthase [Actinomycetota bacterium]
MNITTTISGLDREVRFGDVRYPFSVRSGAGSWQELTQRLEELDADRFVIVTEHGIPASLVAHAQMQLSSVAPCQVIDFAASEKTKTVATLDDLADKALIGKVTRQSVIVALGGGLAGNVAGLLAALLFRGIRLVHMPTTLLGMSDSVLSLKQAVNSGCGKNHLGTFHEPVLVWNHLDFLDTLPRAEIQSALCEMIKNVLAICPDRYDEVATRLRTDGRYSRETLTDFIGLCVDAKCAVMRYDPFEKGEALVLEYGHTVGHAAELLTGGKLRHGFAIGVGMLVAARIAVQLGYLDRSDEAAHRALLQRNGAPTTLPAELDLDSLMQAVGLDNKRGYRPELPGTQGLILLDGLGRPHHSDGSLITRIDEAVIHAGIAALLPGSSKRIRTHSDQPRTLVAARGSEQR